MSVASLPPGYDAWRLREPDPDTYVVDVDDLDDQGNRPALHCWEDGPRGDGDIGTTCMLDAGHNGPHRWTRDEDRNNA